VVSENREVRIPARIEDRLKMLEARLTLLDQRVDRIVASLTRELKPFPPGYR
jgi:hypothetical protein